MFLRIWRKGRKSPEYRKQWFQRLGFFKAPKGIEHGLCFHCCSIGETIAAIPLIKALQQKHSKLPITVTATTPTGLEQIKLAFGDSVFYTYLPFDTPGAMKRFIAKIKPQFLIIMETELWPNLLHYAHLNKTKVLIANARLSQQSLKGYLKVAKVSHDMMTHINKVAVQNKEDGQRFLQLGLTEQQLAVVGNVKFDIVLNQELKQASHKIKQLWAPSRPVWVVGSIHLDEITAILHAFKSVLAAVPDTLLVIVPRHPEYFHTVEEHIINEKLTMVKRSDAISPSKTTQVVLGDSMGELLTFWGIADVAFVGGSLIEHGGHNPLEPAAFSAPVISGPHTFNFREVYALLENSEAVLIANNTKELAASVIRLLSDKPYQIKLGNNACQVIKENIGALTLLIAEVEKLLASTIKPQ